MLTQASDHHQHVNLSSRRALGGGGNLDMPGGSRGANTHAKLNSSPAISSLPADLAPLPASLSSCAVAPLKLGQLAQTVLDVLASVVVLLFLGMVALSLPLSLFLMLFASF